jgi:hypothetical protein
MGVRVFSARVVGGTIIVEGDPLPEGTSVTVIAREPAEDFTLNDDDEAELRARIASVDAGETIDEKELRARLRRR